MIENLLKQVKNKNIFTLIDVGAMGDIPKKWEFKEGMMKVIAFEPDQREFKKLRNNAFKIFINSALFKKKEELIFHINKAHGKSSTYPSNYDVLRNFPCYEEYIEEKVEIINKDRVETLEEILKENDIKDPDFLKIDTQGSELTILMGCGDYLLNNILGIQIEVEFIELYKGQPLFRDVDKFLCEKGFSLIDIRRQYWKRKSSPKYRGKGQLIFGDALYFKDINILKQNLNKLNDDEIKLNKLYKMIIISLNYGIYDYALALIDLGKEIILSKKDRLTNVEKEIYKNIKSNFLPEFKGKQMIYKILLKAISAFEGNSYMGWADSDSQIGNIKDI